MIEFTGPASRCGYEGPKVYLAGKMSGVPDFNFPAFTEAAAGLRELGYRVWSPHEADLAEGFDPHTGTAESHRAYMKRDLPAVLEADVVVVLPGWEGSRGALLEVHAGRVAGAEILTWPELEPVPWSSGGGIVFDPRPKHFGFALEDIPAGATGEVRITNSFTSVLTEADGLINGARREAYGHPTEDFTRTGRMWAAILDLEEVLPEQVALCMAALKISRECYAHGRDNLVDGAGYLGTIEKIRDHPVKITQAR